MAAAALVLSLLDDKPVLILAPATLIWQWQEELEDKLGIPAAVWSHAEEMLARRRAPGLDPARRSRTGGKVPVADWHRVDRVET
jgi:hypothetical protein